MHSRTVERVMVNPSRSSWTWERRVEMRWVWMVGWRMMCVRKRERPSS